MSGERTTPDTVRCRVGDVVRRGRVIVVTEDIEATAMATAVRNGTASNGSIAVEAPSPTPVHQHVGCLRPSMGLRTRTALARAGRTRGLETTHDQAIARVAAKLQALREEAAGSDEHPGETDESGPEESPLSSADENAASSPEQDRHAVRDETRTAVAETLTDQRRAAAATATETAAIRERVAAARGRLEARRDHGLDTAAAAEELADAIADLSEAETESAAAEQQLGRVRTAVRERRDLQERQFELEDRLANLRRRARSDLVGAVQNEFATTLAAVPEYQPGDDPLDAPPVPAALAIASLAALRAPVVLAIDRFDSPGAASEWLDAPVIDI